jgi:hypothetical protein
MFVEKNSQEDITKYIYDEGTSISITSVATSLVNNKKRKNYFKARLNENNYFKNSTLLKINNNSLILEKTKKTIEKNKEKKAVNKNNKYAMALSFVSYYLLSIKMLTKLVEIQTQKTATCLILNEKVLEAVTKKENFDDNVLKLAKEKINEINVLVKEFNKEKELIKKYKIEIENIENNDLENVSKGVKKIIDMLDETKKETSSADTDVKDLAYANVMKQATQGLSGNETSKIKPTDIKIIFKKSYLKK